MWIEPPIRGFARDGDACRIELLEQQLLRRGLKRIRKLFDHRKADIRRAFLDLVELRSADADHGGEAGLVDPAPFTKALHVAAERDGHLRLVARRIRQLIDMWGGSLHASSVTARLRNAVTWRLRSRRFFQEKEALRPIYMSGRARVPVNTLFRPHAIFMVVNLG